MDIHFQIWFLDLPFSMKSATLSGSVLLLTLGPLNLGVPMVKLYLASGSYFKVMATKIAHTFP
jgi:hypothetical protein